MWDFSWVSNIDFIKFALGHDYFFQSHDLNTKCMLYWGEMNAAVIFIVFVAIIKISQIQQTVNNS